MGIIGIVMIWNQFSWPCYVDKWEKFGLFLASIFCGDHGIMDVSYFLETFACHDSLYKCIVGGVLVVCFVPWL